MASFSASNSTRQPRRLNQKHVRTFVEQDEAIGEGDSELVCDILPPEIAHTAFENLRQEVQWQAMKHRGGEVPRLVAQQGEVSSLDGSFPIYRHPSDKSPPLFPFSPTVALIREHVQNVLQQPVNHVLIQHYRSGADFISEHSDKTIDIVRGSRIVNVSLGARRHMTLRSKDAEPKDGGKRRIQRVKLPHNSMFVLGLATNEKWQHSVKHDNRPNNLKDEDELYNNGERISLTFRHIGTFVSQDQKVIWGQGAKGKAREDAQAVVNGGSEAEKLLAAFGIENHSSEFDWEAHYGEGFDVLHLTSELPFESDNQ